MDTGRAHRFRRELLGWAEDNLRSFPWRDPDASLYEVFVAEFFLTQTPADNVADVYPAFLDRFGSLEAIRGVDEATLASAIEPLGFQNMRASALKTIAAEHDSLPRSSEALQALPRVGDYVANASLCFALDRRLPIVDRNVVRVYDRVFGEQFPKAESSRREFAAAMLPVSRADARTFNLALLDFGAAICQKQDPACATCFANEFCAYVN